MAVSVRRWEEIGAEERERLFRRSETDIDEVRSSVSSIIQQVKEGGDSALLELGRKYDGVDLSAQGLKVGEDEFAQAKESLAPEMKESLIYAMENIKSFHRAQRPESMAVKEIRPGLFAGERASAIDSAALYVPRGRGSFPSMLYMLAIPALIAEVPRIVITSPPGADGKMDPASLFTADYLGIRDFYRIGGAQAIAALATGTETIPRVEKIIGPGSMYVAAAKQLLSALVDVGLPAGPSESIVIADKDADPRLAALDLLVEAEHGSDSAALLLTDSPDLAAACAEIIETQLSKLSEPRRSFVQDVLAGGYGGIIICSSIDEAVSITNNFAPEHLELQVKEPFSLLNAIRNAGEILLGENVPFSCANYLTGVNAVLPTGGKAKSWSAVSVRDFMKYSSLVWAGRDAYHEMALHTRRIAEYEGFLTHAGAVKERFS